MTRSFNIPAAPLFERDTSVTFNNSLYSATDTLGGHTYFIPCQSYLTTPLIRNVSTYSDILIDFQHIAYIEQFSFAYIQISFDDGNNWENLDTNYHTGSSYLIQSSNYGFGFNKTSRPLDWRYLPTNDTSYIWTSSNAIWAKETFTNLSNRIQLSGSDSIRLRVVLEDGLMSAPGNIGTYRYYIDDFRVIGLRTVSLKEKQSQFESKLKIYPNPVENNLHFSNQSEDNLALSVRNISGKQVLLTNSKSKSKQQIDFSALTSGVYFIIAKSEKNQKGFKVIKK